VGPGLGILTRELAKRAARIIAVEVDINLVRVLNRTFGTTSNVSIINADILKTDVGQLFSHSHEEKNTPQYKVIANLPYYITSPILRHFLENPLKPYLMVVMVQKEVGEAITAQPGDMSLLAIGVQFYGQPDIIDYVPAQSFHPQPKVDSVILRIKPHPYPPIEVANVDRFFQTVRAGFSLPRKQLHNSLSHGLEIPPEDANTLLEKAGIDPRRRAETLSLKEWDRVCAMLTDYRL
jgi:16S rRNA (adenine1518-N6/adenine1519-N6)-dimethyltransferase